MAKPSYSDLLDRIQELESENEVLSDKIDSILEIAGDEDDDELEDEDDDDDVR